MRNRILVCVKTYPNLSTLHQETMCTAGIDENGNWHRIYPINYRKLPKEQKFKKYQWIEYGALKDIKDPRLESYKITTDITLQSHINTKLKWFERKQLIDKCAIYYDIKEVIGLTRNNKSLFVFKPYKVLNCLVTVDYCSSFSKKYEIFPQYGYDNLAEQIPYKVYYKFVDQDKNISTLQIIDWELYQLIRKLIVKYKGQDAQIAKCIKKKYLDEIAIEKDCYLFLGTNKYWHIRKSKNPLMIIGIFYPPLV